MDHTTDVGPLVNKEAVEKVEGQVKDALSKGATAFFGEAQELGKDHFTIPRCCPT